MDLALSRFRTPICPGEPRSPIQWCPDQEQFERLVSEMAVALSPPMTTPAHSLGPRGFQIGFSSTITTIDAESLHHLESYLSVRLSA